ncbi:hypothetical protein ZOSMA_21G00110 [Zostera marina]|uniref:Uncharacterized protein n=1 Tax=Zostera marina TaxID=29655 RepID=A0A0K9PJN3_ZOSMR|nr:hypothetical protein ZOSMA_21G00110 [Zostera marina]
MAQCHLLNTIACRSPLFFLSSTLKHRQQLECQPNDGRLFRRGLLCLSSDKKTRMVKKIKPASFSMSDTDLCSEIRDFAFAEGLPNNCIPSMAQLSRCGRRKEFRVVTQLRRTQTNGDVFKPETNLTMNQEDSTNTLNNKHSQTPVMLMQNEGSVISQQTVDLFPSEQLRESEINHLKTMLNKKEMELLILKKEIEKEQVKHY